MNTVLESNFQKLFEVALGIEEPWFLEDMEFKPDTENKMAVFLKIGFKKGSKFKDLQSKELCSVYDTRERTWRHMNFFQYRCYVSAKVPRIETKDGIKTIEVPWGREGSGFTLMMEGIILTLASHMPIATVAREIGETDNKIWRVLKYHVSKAKANMSLDDVEAIGVDEYSHRGHNYITTFFSRPTAKHSKSRVIGIENGKGKDTVTVFTETFCNCDGRIEKVKSITSDMCHGYRNAMKESFPDALLTIDKFHVIKTISDAVDAVRRRESKYFNKRKNPILEKSRYLLLANRENLNEENQKRLDELLKCTDIDSVIAYNFKLRLQELYKQEDYESAAMFLEELALDLCNSSVHELHTVGQCLTRNAIEILNYYTTKNTNAFLEGFNSVISQIKSAARGFRNFEYFKTMIWFRLGDFEFPKLPIMG